MQTALLWLGVVAAASAYNATCPDRKTSVLLLLQDSDTGSSFLTQLLSGHECSQSWVEKGSRPDGHFRAKRSEDVYKSLLWSSDRTPGGGPCVKGRVMEAHLNNIGILNGPGPRSLNEADRHVLVLLRRNPLFVALGQLKKTYYKATAKMDPKSKCKNANQERLCHGLSGFTFPVENIEKFDARVRHASEVATDARAFTKKFSERLGWPSADVAYPELLRIQYVTGRALVPAPLLRHLGLIPEDFDGCDAKYVTVLLLLLLLLLLPLLLPLPLLLLLLLLLRLTNERNSPLRYADLGVCVVPGDANTLSEDGNHKSSPKNPMNQVTNLDELRAWANSTGAPWGPLLDLDSEVDAPLELDFPASSAGGTGR